MSALHRESREQATRIRGPCGSQTQAGLGWGQRVCSSNNAEGCLYRCFRDHCYLVSSEGEKPSEILVHGQEQVGSIVTWAGALPVPTPPCCWLQGRHDPALSPMFLLHVKERILSHWLIQKILRIFQIVEYPFSKGQFRLLFVWFLFLLPYLPKSH